jgi:GNAT superfamily N-acetyltransferase
VEIMSAETDEDRVAIRDFFAQYIDDVASNAVPSLENEDLYRPLVPWVRDGSGGIVAAALSCRTQVAALAATTARRGGPIPPVLQQYLPVLDKHSELDLLVVRPDHRGEGLGSQLLTWMEDRLRCKGVRVWLGSATTALASVELRRFFDRNGFATTNPGEALPPLLGRIWAPPLSAEQPDFYIYKALPARRS